MVGRRRHGRAGGGVPHRRGDLLDGPPRPPAQPPADHAAELDGGRGQHAEPGQHRAVVAHRGVVDDLVVADSEDVGLASPQPVPGRPCATNRPCSPDGRSWTPPGPSSATGYATTSIDDIAAAAQVARATVDAIGGKPELLKRAYDSAHEEVPMAQRPEAARIVAEPDPVAGLHLYVDMSLGIGARVGAVHVALRAAAGDERVRAIYDEIQDGRAAAARRVVDFFVARGAPIADPATAADVLWVLVDPGLHPAFVHDRGGPGSGWPCGSTRPSPRRCSMLQGRVATWTCEALLVP